MLRAAAAGNITRDECSRFYVGVIEATGDTSSSKADYRATQCLYAVVVGPTEKSQLDRKALITFAMASLMHIVEAMLLWGGWGLNRFHKLTVKQCWGSP